MGNEDPFHPPAPAASPEPEPRRRRNWPHPVLLTAAAGLTLSAALFLFVRSGERRAWQTEFARRTELPAAALRRDLEDDLNLLRSLAALALASRGVDRHEFHGFTQSMLARVRNVERLEWIPRVPEAARLAHEQQARQQGVPWYQIQDRDARGRLVRAPRRAGYYPICFIEPAAYSEDLGWDLGQNTADRAAMNWARELPNEVASVPYPRRVGTNLAYRCRVFLAVFTNQLSPGTVEQRRQNLAGYAAVVLDFGRLMESALTESASNRVAPATSRGMAWQLIDETVRGAPPIRLWQTANWQEALSANRGGEVKVALPVGGRNWVWRCRPAADAAPPAGYRDWGVLAAGVLITALLCVSLGSALGRAAQVERLVQERTAALDRSNQELRGEIRRREQMEVALQAERRWVSALLETIPDHIYFKDRESRFLRINTAMARRFKLSAPDQAVGRTDFDFFTAEHAERAFADEQEILRTGNPLIGREELETWPDGTTSWVSSTKECLRDATGNVVGTFGISRDITLRKQAERRLAVQYLVAKVLAEADSFAAAAPRILQEIGQYLGWTVGALWKLDRTTGALQCAELWQAEGAGAQAFLEASQGLRVARGEDWPGRVWASAEPIWMRDVATDAAFPRAKAAARAGLHGAVGFPICSAGGVLGVIEFFSLQFEQPEPELLRLFAAVGSQIGQFIERKRMEQELAAKALELERSNRELEQFAYVASHDLQEPLRMIASYTQLLGRRYGANLDDDAHQFIRYAVEGAARMQALINDLLAYSRVGTRTKPFTHLDTSQILHRALKNLEVAIQESGAEINAAALPVVSGDATQLTQLFQNLVANALKFRGEKPARVRISAVPEGDGPARVWHFAVSDAGIGIDSKYFERIFVIFQRLHTRDEYPGTGIGLALCKKIVERHGGRIWVESAPGQGATFHFTLPAAGADNEDAAVGSA